METIRGSRADVRCRPSAAPVAGAAALRRPEERRAARRDETVYCGARVVTCATTPAARAIGDRVCDTFLPGDADGLAEAIAAARCAPRDRRAAAELAARHGWHGVFTAELERLRELAR